MARSLRRYGFSMSSPDPTARGVVDRPQGILRDLGWTLRAWGDAPWFVVFVIIALSIGVVCAVTLPLLGTAYEFLYAGFLGAEWLFYLRKLTGRALAFYEVPAVAVRFVGRFVTLGLMTFGPLCLLLLLLVVLAHHDATSVTVLSGRIRALIIAYEYLADIMLTFVPAALVFSSDTATGAVRFGLHYLRRTWPSCAVYAFTPGLTLSLIAFVLPPGGLGKAAIAGISITAGVVGFAFKGAIASFYVRNLSPADRRYGTADP